MLRIHFLQRWYGYSDPSARYVRFKRKLGCDTTPEQKRIKLADPRRLVRLTFAFGGSDGRLVPICVGFGSLHAHALLS
jgi:hypothetical protein